MLPGHCKFSVSFTVNIEIIRGVEHVVGVIGSLVVKYGFTQFALDKLISLSISFLELWKLLDL